MTYDTEKTYFAPIGLLVGATGGFLFMAVRAIELRNIEKEEGQKKKFRYQDGDLGVLSFDNSKEE